MIETEGGKKRVKIIQGGWGGQWNHRKKMLKFQTTMVLFSLKNLSCFVFLVVITVYSIYDLIHSQSILLRSTGNALLSKPKAR